MSAYGYRDRDNPFIERAKILGISLILKIAGIGIIASVACQILQKSGRDEQATFVTVAGVVVVMLLLAGEISGLFSTLRSVFGL